MPSVAKNLDEIVTNHAMRDLSPGAVAVHFRAGAAAILGGLLSLLICGQFGIGWTSLADTFSAKVHSTMHPLACAMVCGGLFAIFPVALLRLFSRPMLFRVVIRRWVSSF